MAVTATSPAAAPPPVPLTLRERCVREGLVFGAAGTYSASPAAGSTAALSTLNASLPPLGQTAYLDTYTIWASRACEFRLQWYPGGAGVGTSTPYTPAANVWAGWDDKYTLSAAGSKEIPLG